MKAPLTVVVFFASLASSANIPGYGLPGYGFTSTADNSDGSSSSAPGLIKDNYSGAGRTDDTGGEDSKSDLSPAARAAAAAGIVSGASDPDDETGSYMGSQAAGYGATGYGGPRQKCSPYWDTVYEDKCIKYEDQVCTTSHKESCTDIPGKNCKAIVSSKQVRKCFDVTELICSLKEDIQYEVIKATYTVQKCHKNTERVCDTVYETRYTPKDDYKCLSFNNVYCWPQQHTLQDKVCKSVTNFDCSSESDEHFSGSYGGTHKDNYVTPSSEYGGGTGNKDEDNSDPYAPKDPCKRWTEKKCYNTPRETTIEKCETRPEKFCEKLHERVPFPVEKQSCHNEDRKVCELEQRQQPKQVKKYVYTKVCRPIPRKICENADVKELVQSCVPKTHKECTYAPTEKCNNVPKEYCYKIGRKVKKQKCDPIPYSEDLEYNAETAYTANA